MMLLHQLMIFGKYCLFKRIPHHQLSMMKQDHQSEAFTDIGETERWTGREREGEREREGVEITGNKNIIKLSQTKLSSKMY